MCFRGRVAVNVLVYSNITRVLYWRWSRRIAERSGSGAVGEIKRTYRVLPFSGVQLEAVGLHPRMIAVKYL